MKGALMFGVGRSLLNLNLCASLDGA